MSAVDVQLQADVETKAKELYEIARPAFDYARKGTPDGTMFDQSERGRLLLNAMRRVAAHMMETTL